MKLEGLLGVTPGLEHVCRTPYGGDLPRGTEPRGRAMLEECQEQRVELIGRHWRGAEIDEQAPTVEVLQHSAGVRAPRDRLHVGAADTRQVAETEEAQLLRLGEPIEELAREVGEDLSQGIEASEILDVSPASQALDEQDESGSPATRHLADLAHRAAVQANTRPDDRANFGWRELEVVPIDKSEQLIRLGPGVRLSRLRPAHREQAAAPRHLIDRASHDLIERRIVGDLLNVVEDDDRTLSEPGEEFPEIAAREAAKVTAILRRQQRQRSLPGTAERSGGQA
jgi:hypothetical protein